MKPKHVTQALPTLLPASRTFTTPAGQTEPAPLNDHGAVLVNLVFAKMQARYGVKFHSQFKSEEQLDYAKREWLDELSKLDEPTVLRGMDGMLKAFMSWPPNLQEFLALCRPQREHGQMYKQFVPMLCKSTQAERDALAAIHLTALKNMLR